MGNNNDTTPNIQNIHKEKIVWIDSRINNNENLYYRQMLTQMNFEVFAFNNTEEGITKIKTFKYCMYIKYYCIYIIKW